MIYEIELSFAKQPDKHFQNKHCLRAISHKTTMTKEREFIIITYYLLTSLVVEITVKVLVFCFINSIQAPMLVKTYQICQYKCRRLNW